MLDNVCSGLQLIDGRKLIGERSDAHRFDRLGVHETAIEITNSLHVAVRILRFGRLLHDGVDVFDRFVREAGERAVVGLVCGDLGVLQPKPVDVGEQVVLRSHPLVEVVGVDPGTKVLSQERASGCQQRESEGDAKRHRGDPQESKASSNRCGRAGGDDTRSGFRGRRW